MLSYDISDETVRDFARIMGIELVVINKDTTKEKLERDIMIGDVIYGR